MKSKGLTLVVTLIAIAAIPVSGGTVMAAGGWHGGGHGGGGHWGGGWHGGWGWGWPIFGLGVAAGALLSYPYYYQPYYPYYPYDPSYAYAPTYSPSPRVIVREREPAYADERVYSEPAPARYSARDTWYYCKKSNAYYPYVRRCAGGWEKVPAVPPSSEPDDYR